MSVLEYCDKRIKEASDNGDYKSFKAYTEIKEMWIGRLEDMKGAPVMG